MNAAQESKNAERIVFYPIQFIVCHPLSPIPLQCVLPSHIKRVVGVQVAHATGIEQMLSVPRMPLIGLLSLSFNSKKYQFGKIVVAYNNTLNASAEFLETLIEIEPNALLIGNYENRVCMDSQFVNADNSLTNKWKNYLCTLNLKCWSND
jgi:hypothetical protein